MVRNQGTQRKSFTHDVSLSIASMFVLLLVLITLGWTVSAIILLQNSIKTEEKYIQSILKSSITKALWEMDEKALETVAQSVISNSALAEFVVQNEEGHTVFSYSKKVPPLPFVSSEKSIFKHFENSFYLGQTSYKIDVFSLIERTGRNYLIYLFSVVSIFVFMLISTRYILLQRLREPLDEIVSLIATYGTLAATIKDDDANLSLYSKDEHHGYIEFEGIKGLLLSLRETILNQFKELNKAIQDRELLMRELNHRIRNNLQLLAAIINQQADESISMESRERQILNKLLGRIDTISEAYGLLLETRKINGIEMGSYLSAICGLFYQTVGNGGLEINLRVMSVVFPLDVAIASGLIVYELLSNTAMHAYAGRYGNASVSLQQEENTFVLTVSDQGPGSPVSLLHPPETVLGFRFINALAAQINAQLEEQNRNGYSVSLKIGVDTIQTAMKKELYST
jgi:two-component sensor histidine kinase